MKLNMSNVLTIGLQISIKLVHYLILLIEEHLYLCDLGFLIERCLIAVTFVSGAVVGESDLSGLQKTVQLGRRCLFARLFLLFALQTSKRFKEGLVVWIVVNEIQTGILIICQKSRESGPELDGLRGLKVVQCLIADFIV